jgi:Right handed beta helix region
LVKGKFLTVCALILVALGSHTAIADTYSVPLDFTTIGEALSAARFGDVILIDPGYYPEHGLTLPGGVHLGGSGDSPEETIIDGLGEGRILQSLDDAGPSTVFNLTMRNGHARGATSYDKSGGAIYVNGGILRVYQCHFIGNRADAHGGAIRCILSSPEIIECMFQDNSALIGGGGAVDCSYDASPIIRGCTFTSNLSAWGGALSCRGNASPDVVACFFHHNQSGGSRAYGGGALAFFGSSPQFTLCTFFDNRADFGGAVAALPGAPIKLRHCTLTENRAENGAGLYNWDATSIIESSIIAFQDGTGITGNGVETLDISCSNIHGNSSGDLQGLAEGIDWTDGNLSVDPLFCGPDEFGGIRFNLDVESPCVTESNTCGTMGAWEAGCEGTRGIQTIADPPRVLTIENVSAFPNPFNPTTRIRFELESNQRILAEIYSIDGRRVRVLADQEFSAGWNTLPWNGIDGSGRSVGSGIYLVRLQGEAMATSNKITLLK